MSLILAPNVNENTTGPNNGNIGFPGGTKGYVTSYPINPLFNFKANGIYTYNTDYFFPLIVDSDTGALKAADDGDDFVLPDGFDSLALDATITDTFDVDYTTGEGTNSATVTITITGLNDDPTALDDLYGTVVAGGGTVTIDVLDNDFDIDVYEGDGDLFGDTFEINSFDVTSTEGGTITLNANGTDLDYTAPTGFIGIDTFTYDIVDQHGAFSGTATVTVVVGPENTAPTAVDDSYMVDEDDGLTLFSGTNDVLYNDTDPDTGDQALLGAILKTDVYYSNSAGAAQANTDADGTGDIVFNADGSFSYNPGGNFDYLGVGDSAYVAFEYTVFDGDLNSSDDGLVVIQIKGENDDPTGTDGSATVYERGLSTGTQPVADMLSDNDIIQTIDMQISDPDDSDVLVFAEMANGTNQVSMTSSYGTLVFNTDGTVTYTLAAPWDHDTLPAEDVFDFYVIDQEGGSKALTATITIGDDNPFLGDSPTLAEGADNDIDGNLQSAPVFVSNGSNTSDTFDYYPGADGSTLSVIKKPGQFTLYDENGDAPGGEVTVTSTYDAASNTVTGTFDNGEFAGQEFYTLVVDDSDPTGSYLFTILKDPPDALIPLDFGGGVNPGGPSETKVPNGITFDGGSIDTGDYGDLAGSWDTELNDGDYLLNPNNGGGIGVGNGNIDLGEAIKITTGTQEISGFSLDITGVGGGVANSEPLYLTWEAWSGGVEVDVGKIEITGITGEVTELISPDFDFDTIYLTFEGMDHNDKLRINNISALKAVEVDDFALTFGLGAAETGTTSDGDTAPPTASEGEFTIYVDGTDADMIFT